MKSGTVHDQVGVMVNRQRLAARPLERFIVEAQTFTAYKAKRQIVSARKVKELWQRDRLMSGFTLVHQAPRKLRKQELCRPPQAKRSQLTCFLAGTPCHQSNRAADDPSMLIVRTSTSRPVHISNSKVR